METAAEQKLLTSFLEQMSQSTHEKGKLFRFVQALALKDSDFSIETYAQIAFFILDAIEKSFIQDRGEDFFFWFIKSLASFPNRRQSEVSLLRHTVSYPFQSKEVVGILLSFHEVILNALPNLETFQRMLLQKFSTFYLVEGSSFSLVRGKKTHLTLYFEVQKTEDPFTDKEIAFLQTVLQQMIRENFGSSSHSLIVPSNRELLLKSFRAAMDTLEDDDMPEVLIDFNRQVQETLYFSALICQVKKESAPSLQSRLKHPNIEIDTEMTFHENNLIKEGMILSIEVPFSLSSLPLIQGRIEAVSLIESLLGRFRDVNGGLLEQGLETLHLLEKEIKAPQESIKKFFHSITPQEAQATLSVPLLKALYFAMQKEARLNQETHYHWEEIEEGVCICLKTSNPPFEKDFRKFLHTHTFSPMFIAEPIPGGTIIGSVLPIRNKEERESLRKKIHDFYHEWLEKKELKQVLRLSINSDFSSLDPRVGTDEETSYLHKMLFEGLMRIGKEGTPELAIAERIEKLDGGKRYRFFLKKSIWSNGLPLTAHDFVHSWRMTLLPDFLSPLSYLFYSIENGRAIKEGKVSPHQLGVEALDDLTLEVRLHGPIPYFLALCALSVFSPVCSKIDQKDPSWSYSYRKGYVCNGPFTLESYCKGKELILKKNPFYWEEKAVHLEKVLISKHSSQESLNQFEMGQIDALFLPWYRPHMPLTVPAAKRMQGAPCVCYLSLNCIKPPFQNRKIRQALSLALDRNALASFYSKEATPTYTLYSPIFSQIKTQRDKNRLSALKLLMEGLEEEGMHLQDILEETIYVSQANAPLILLILEQLKSTLYLKWRPCILDSSEFRFSSLHQEFTAKLYWWFNRLEDPSYFLETFSSKKSSENYTFWTDDRLQRIIDRLQQERFPEKRKILHKKAEALLKKEQPFIPLFYMPTFSFLQPYLHNVYSCISEHFDLRHSYKS